MEFNMGNFLVLTLKIFCSKSKENVRVFFFACIPPARFLISISTYSHPTVILSLDCTIAVSPWVFLASPHGSITNLTNLFFYLSDS